MDWYGPTPWLFPFDIRWALAVVVFAICVWELVAHQTGFGAAGYFTTRRSKKYAKERAEKYAKERAEKGRNDESLPGG